MAKNNVQSVSYLLCTQVIEPQIIQKLQNQSCTQIYIKQNIHKHRTQNFLRISPFGITPVKKAHKARTRWYRGPFLRFINTSCCCPSVHIPDRAMLGTAPKQGQVRQAVPLHQSHDGLH